MGPVSFDVVELGSERGEAIRLTALVRAAGLRVDLREIERDEHTAYQLFVRSTDLTAARSALGDRHTD